MSNLCWVVEILTDINNNKKVINYRDSKLTMLLKDSIGGNCKTTLIGCVSPSFRFCKETNYTLEFAKSFKKIKNVVRINKYK